MNIFQSIHDADPGFTPRCIFDIGANVGQTVGQIRRVWPTVSVHAFEPVSATFAKLEENTAGDAGLQRHRLAFASRPGRAVMLARPLGLMNRIVEPFQARGPTEEVEVAAGDAFCAERAIDRVDILKIDTEGHDLEVLAGFRNMLATRRIMYVEVECAIAPDNAMHVPFSRLADFLFAFGYGLFNLYAGTRYNLTRKTQDRGIWYGNAVFVAERWPEDDVGAAA
ncbi:FkbM family methyltransferase [Roseomonas rosulenta]|uniref:FkbM family methyltransferase n=1 Tax=Roseomonas rosulenta TaxID=2748667 RepID=UPI0018DFAFE5